MNSYLGYSHILIHIYKFIKNVFIYDFIYEFTSVNMNSYIRNLCQDTKAWHTWNHTMICFYHEFMYEFMISHEFICECWYEFFARTLLSTQEFIVFMKRIMGFGLFSWERSYWKSCLKNIVKNFMKNTVIVYWILWSSALTCSIWRGQAILPLLLQSHLPHCQQATVPIPTTLVLSHTQFLLPERLALHPLESRLPCCDLRAD